MANETQQPTTSSTPTDAPASIEAQRVAITKDPAFWGGSDTAKTAALREQMKTLVSGAPPHDSGSMASAGETKRREAAAAQKPKTDAAAVQVTPQDRRRREVMAKIADRATPEAERDALRRELHALVAERTPEEVVALEEEPLETLRARYGIAADAVPAHLADLWDDEGQAVWLRSAAFHGVEPAAVRAISDWYLKEVFTPAVGQAENIADPQALVAQFRALAKRHGLSKELTDAMIDHYGGEP
jgi:hypothetical protein